MTPPTRAEVIVATGALRTEAGEWDAQSAAIAAVGTSVSTMQLGMVEAGLFFPIVGAYNDVVAAVSSRCAEGGTSMADVATTLRAVAATYDKEDLDNSHKIAGIY